MSKLCRLRLKGIRSFGAENGDEQDMVFSCPVTLIFGENGSGKSTIIEALKYAISGDLQDDGQGFLYDPRLARQAETEAMVKLKIADVKGDFSTITKISNVEQDNFKQTFKNITTKISQGKEIVSDCVDAHKIMCTSLGVSKAVLNYVIFCHQEDTYWPLQEPTKLKERFGAICGAKKYYDSVANLMGVRDKHSKKISTLQTDLENKRFFKAQMELKRDQLRAKEKRNLELVENIKKISYYIDLTQKNIRILNNLENNINILLNDKKQIEQQIKNIKEDSSLNNLNGYNEELNDNILFESNKTLLNKIKILEDNKKEIELKENNLRNDMNKEEIHFGKLLRQQEENQNEINTINKLIDECILDFDLNITLTSNIADTINNFNDSLKSFEKELETLEFCSDIKEKKLQTEIDDYRTSYTHLRQLIAAKVIESVEFKIEFDKLTEKMDACNVDSDKKKHITSQIISVESKITDLESSINKSQHEIENEKQKLSKTEQRYEAVEKEIEIKQHFCIIKTEIDLLNEYLQKKKKHKEVLTFKNQDNIKNIFGDVSLDTLEIDVYLTKQINFINDVKTKIRNKEKALFIIEADLNVQKEQLGVLRRYIEKEGTEITEIFKDSSYEEVESETFKTMEDLLNKKAVNVNNNEIYSTFLQSFKVTNPSCQLCMKEVNENDAKTIIEEIEKKIPEDEKYIELEEKYNEVKKKYSKICELKPTYQKLKKVQKNDISVQIERISEIEINARKTKEDINLLKNSIEAPINDIETVRKMLSDIGLITQYSKEIIQLREKIKELSKQLPKKETTRTAQEALLEQVFFKSSLKNARTKIQEGNDKLFKNLKLLQVLKSRYYDLKEQEFTMNKNILTKELLETQRNEIESKITIIKNSIEEMQSEIELKSSALTNALNNKETNKLKYRQEREELQSKITSFKKILNDIITLENNINLFIQENIDEQVSSINKTLNKNNQIFIKFTEEKENIMQNIHKLKNQLKNSENIQKLHEKNNLLIKLQDELKAIEGKLSIHDINEVKTKIIKLTKNLNSLNSEMHKTQGQIKEIKNVIKDNFEELSDPIYSEAESNVKEAFLKYNILLKAVKDVDIFIQAMKYLILEVQKKSTARINNKIRVLWKEIYNKNDIDYIVIDESYNVMQVKNEIKMNMRGNCSTGQKVVASLVIRLAFAEVFSEKCGIFVLDEPTANLDQETIENFCAVLSDLIQYKKYQKNFQLIIITLDQYFFNKLRFSLLIDTYYLVSKNEKGKSIITFKDDYFEC